MYDDAHIATAQAIIQQCLELVQLEEQRNFLLMRLEMDLEEALEALEAVQTVVVAPFVEGVQVLTPPPQRYNLGELDEGEPSAYEVEHD